MRTNPVKLIECPRDAWQGMPQQIPVETKVDYLRALIAAGFKHMDAVSFVSPTAVPQMSDSEQVLAMLDPDTDVEIIGIVVNRQGAERAVRSSVVDTLGFPYSLSETFLQRNQKQTKATALETLGEICALASSTGLDVVAYLSMAFGNPYGDPWQHEDVIAACRTLQALGLKQISLADTVGMAEPEQIESLLSAVLAAVPGVELGAHLHARPQDAAEKVAAAYRAGCRRLDSALGGYGGCPFAQDALVGNVATEAAIAELRRLGAELPRLGPLDHLLTMGQNLADRFGTAKAC
jgi:hydroxymethylglutaryl-CoA lyase